MRTTEVVNVNMNSTAKSKPISAGYKASHLANELWREMDRTSIVVNREREDAIPKFKYSELVLGKQLGCGRNNSVYSIQKVRLSDHVDNQSDDQTAGRNRVAKRPYEYCIKFLKTATEASEQQFIDGAADLACEAKFLASLQHPHLITLQGLSCLGVQGFEKGSEGFFIVVDRLVYTLKENLEYFWHMRRPSHAQQLQTCYNLGQALSYLHKRNVSASKTSLSERNKLNQQCELDVPCCCD